VAFTSRQLAEQGVPARGSPDVASSQTEAAAEWCTWRRSAPRRRRLRLVRLKPRSSRWRRPLGFPQRRGRDCVCQAMFEERWSPSGGVAVPVVMPCTDRPGFIERLEPRLRCVLMVHFQRCLWRHSISGLRMRLFRPVLTWLREQIR
jgi:hypothetical protein